MVSFSQVNSIPSPSTETENNLEEKKKNIQREQPQQKKKYKLSDSTFLKLKKHRQNNSIRNQESGYLWGRGEKLVSSINILGISIRNYFISLECYVISRYVKSSDSPQIHDHYSLSLPHKITFSTMKETMSREQSFVGQLTCD